MAIDQEIQAYDLAKEDLERNHMGKWVVFHDQKLVDVFADATAAAEEAIKKFGRGPYLIRQVGASSLTLPASVLYFPSYATS
jgi:hypothetical protein